MKSKMHQVSVRENRLSGNEQVRIEIETFLQALDSYPKYFSKDPETTFEKYCSSLVPAGRKDAGDSN
jgi:hypothetical protein